MTLRLTSLRDPMCPKMVQDGLAQDGLTRKAVVTTRRLISRLLHVGSYNFGERLVRGRLRLHARSVCHAIAARAYNDTCLRSSCAILSILAP